MCAQEAKHNQIIDLSDTHTPQKEISKIVGVSERSGSGGHHWKRSKVFLETLKDKITEDPAVSMRRHAKTLNVDLKTIKTAVTLDLGLKSFFRQSPHLLTKSIKQKRFNRCKKILSSNTMAGFQQ